MAITRLKRKHRKNIARANNKQRVIKQLLSTPVIKNVDIEELKAQFGKTSAADVVSNVKEKVSKVATAVADKVEDVVEAVKSKVAQVTESKEETAADPKEEKAAE